MITFFNQTDEDCAVKKNRNIILDSSRGSASSLSSEKNDDFDFLRDVPRFSEILATQLHATAVVFYRLRQL